MVRKRVPDPPGLEDMRARLGRRIRALRRERGLTLQDLADAAELQRTYLGDIERGTRNPALKSLYLIARTLGVPLREIFPPPDEPPEGDMPR